MKYEELYNDFIELFPDDVQYFKQMEAETGADVNDGIHVVFAMIIVPFIIKVVEDAPDKAKIAFGYFEKMEKADDPQIAEVLEFTVLENLLTEDKNVFSKCETFFGEETKKAVKAVGKWFK